jgi:hypothetical protein
MPVEPQFSESVVVGDTLPEAFRFGQRAVEVQKETAQFAVHAEHIIARVPIISLKLTGDVRPTVPRVQNATTLPYHFDGLH